MVAGMDQGVNHPLGNIVVADFSRVLAGPFASMTLGDLGADVIKIEEPEAGDDTRAWGPPWRDGQSTYFLGLNRNKRSIALDLKDEDDRALAIALCSRADIMLESFRPGLMASWGLDGDSLRKQNPGLISCSITAFGSQPGGAELPGYDLLVQAMSGLMSITGEADGPPLKVGSAVVDLVCGLLAVVGIQAALRERDATGRGRHVEVSLMDSALTALLNQGSSWIIGETLPRRNGNRHPSIAPYDTFNAADRPFALAVGNDRLFIRMCEAIGAKDLIDDERFNTNSARVIHVDELSSSLQKIFQSAPAEHWVTVLRAAKVPAGPINSVAEAFSLAKELGLSEVETIDHTPIPLSAILIDNERRPIRRTPPKLDEHGEEIRAWLEG
jgi:crotonobetainyl-CoA:carnitine CoA-transferase CaiB-like acyl-CoA transferase